MPIDQYSAFVLFAWVSSITPGPNNLMLLASGTNFGFRRTIPHLLGVSIGFCVLIMVIWAGLSQLFERNPASYQILKVVGICYMLYLAWRMISATALQSGKSKTTAAKPFTFLEAALFQWVNPKAWTMGVTAISLFLPPSSGIAAAIVVTATFGLVNLPSVMLWVGIGTKIRGLLENPKYLQWFNWLMALLLLLSLYPVLR